MLADISDVMWWRELSKEQQERIKRLIMSAIPYDLSYSTKDEILNWFAKL